MGSPEVWDLPKVTHGGSPDHHITMFVYPCTQHSRKQLQMFVQTSEGSVLQSILQRVGVLSSHFLQLLSSYPCQGT